MPPDARILRGGGAAHGKRAKLTSSSSSRNEEEWEGEGSHPKRPRVSGGARSFRGEKQSEMAGRGAALSRKVAAALAGGGDAARGAEMTRYMKGHFPHYGVGAADRRKIAKGVLGKEGISSPKELSVDEVRCALS